VPSNVLGDPAAHAPVLEAHVDAGEVEGVEDQLDLLPDQGGVDLVDVAVERDCGGLGDAALDRPEEGLRERLGGGLGAADAGADQDGEPPRWLWQNSA
jgi:hypothetical protein